ncbi:hypothetical protein BC833DRAFT_595719 [Globomyces pollinis-pini]|nr:hypothetical protein BC833DRAFT_595719 [Globomyces pollinis-pini]
MSRRKQVQKKATKSDSKQIQLGNVIDRCRDWRDSSFSEKQYESAYFWGEQLLSLKDDPLDRYILADIMYSREEYRQCESLLISNTILKSSSWSQYLIGLCYVKLEKWELLIELVNSFSKGRKSNTDLDIEIEKRCGKSAKLSAKFSHLRGIAYLNQGLKENAKENFIDAIKQDLNCFESFDMLLSNYLLNADEERSIIKDLPFDQVTTFEADFIKCVYTSRLTKYNNVELIKNTHEILHDSYSLTKGRLVQLGKTELLMIQRDYFGAIKILDELLIDFPYNMDVLTLYGLCLQELSKTNQLFTLGHQLVELFPKHHVTWYIVGLYYFAIQKYIDARFYFEKSTKINPTFGHGWIGYGHSFSLEKEHDLAISIYSSASKVLSGIHLPNLYLGMEHACLNHWKLAKEFLSIAYSSCKSDPLVFNELGFVYYKEKQYDMAVTYFSEGLRIIQDAKTPLKKWSPSLCNLGHSFRQLGKHPEARKYFEQVAEDLESCESAYSGLALICVIEAKQSEAIKWCHKALAINRNNVECQSLLEMALLELASSQPKTEHLTEQDKFLNARIKSHLLDGQEAEDIPLLDDLMADMEGTMFTDVAIETEEDTHTFNPFNKSQLIDMDHNPFATSRPTGANTTKSTGQVRRRLNFQPSSPTNIFDDDAPVRNGNPSHSLFGRATDHSFGSDNNLEPASPFVSDGSGEFPMRSGSLFSNVQDEDVEDMDIDNSESD